MKLLIDTDILVDVAMKREPFAEPAALLLDGLEARPGIGAVAWHTAANFYFVVKKPMGDALARDFLYQLTRFIEVAPTDSAHLRIAAKSGLRDFEDAMQVAAALALGADAIVTRNVKDYRSSPIPAIGPEEAARLLE